MLPERPRHCTLDCNLCGKVCPTDAIHVPDYWEASALGLGKRARVDKSWCVAWQKGKHCMRCQGVCPIKGAIVSGTADVFYHGQSRHTNVPIVVPDLCVGCGICTDVCPAAMPAIRVSR